MHNVYHICTHWVDKIHLCNGKYWYWSIRSYGRWSFLLATFTDSIFSFALLCQMRLDNVLSLFLDVKFWWQGIFRQCLLHWNNPISLRVAQGLSFLNFRAHYSHWTSQVTHSIRWKTQLKKKKKTRKQTKTTIRISRNNQIASEG